MEIWNRPEQPKLDIHCAYCGGAVTIQMSEWPSVINHDLSPVPADHPGLQLAVWKCPYCEKQNEGGFPGRMAWVTKREDEGSETPH